MAHLGAVHQWELFAADLLQTSGANRAEIVALFLSSRTMDSTAFDVVTVLPLTKEAGKKRKIFPFEVRLPANTAGNDLDRIIMPQQIRTISKSRSLEPLGVLTDAALRIEVEDRMLDHLGISLQSDE